MFFIKKGIRLLAALSLVGSIFIYQSFNNNFTGNNVALASSNQINNLDIEYIKVNNPSGYSEHWRDMKNLQERSDTYDSNGKLVNQVLVLEKGKRVISIGNDNGQLTAYTWALPDDIANENKTLLPKSLLEDVKNDLKKPKWTDKGTKKLPDGRDAKVIEASFEGLTEVVYVDSAEFPIKREFFKKIDGQLKLLEERTEEYKKVSDDSGAIFKYTGTALKEIPAPVGENLKDK